MRARIEDMENKLRDREREAARQVENVKTQAVFAVGCGRTCIGHKLRVESCGAEFGDEEPGGFATPYADSN